MIPQTFKRTDLAIEEEHLPTPCHGVKIDQKEQNGITITSVEIINEEGTKHLNRPIGRYITLDFPPFWQDSEEIDELALENTLTQELCNFLKQEPRPKRVLVVGLGNRAITADAVGPLTADKIEVSGHFESEEALRPYLPPCPVYAISPGVVGNTGIETQKMIQAALLASQATHIIAVDSLAARSTNRLGRSIQISNSGITPGSGIGNQRAALNSHTLGIPVIAIGTPLVVSSSTLVLDALEEAGVERVSDSLLQVLENGKSFFVTLNESDLATKRLSDLIASAINHCITNISEP